MTSLRYTLQLATGAFTGPMRGAQSSLKGFASSLRSMASSITPLAAVTGGLVSVAGASALLKSSISKAADMEALETSFRALLKNGASAKAMVQDLMEFADLTPFDPVPVAATGKQLLAFGFAAKQVKPLLKDIGDLAAAMEKPIDEVGGAFGRLKAGQFGEAFERLRSFGISMQDLLGAGLTFDSSGSFQGSAETAIEAVRQIIRRKFGGGMEDLAGTFKGVFSTFSGYWDSLQRTFGHPVIASLKPLLADATEMLKSWTPLAEQFGRKLGAGIIVVRELFAQGDLWSTAKLGLKLAGATLVNELHAGLQGAVSALFTGLGQAAGIFQRMLGASGLWEGIGGKMEAVFGNLRATLLETFADTLEKLPKYLGGGKENTRSLREGALAASDKAALASGRADAAFSSINTQAIMSSLIEAFRNNTGVSFMKGYREAGEIIPTGEMSSQLASLIVPMMRKAEYFLAHQQTSNEPQRQTAQTVERLYHMFTQHGTVLVRNVQKIADHSTASAGSAF